MCTYSKPALTQVNICRAQSENPACPAASFSTANYPASHWTCWIVWLAFFLPVFSLSNIWKTFLQTLVPLFNPSPVTPVSLLSVLNPFLFPPFPLLLLFCLQVGWQRLLALRGAQVEELCPFALRVFCFYFSSICLLLTHLVSPRLHRFSVLWPVLLLSLLLFSLPPLAAKVVVVHVLTTHRFVDLTGFSRCRFVSVWCFWNLKP